MNFVACAAYAEGPRTNRIVMLGADEAEVEFLKSAERQQRTNMHRCVIEGGEWASSRRLHADEEEELYGRNFELDIAQEISMRRKDGYVVEDLVCR